MASQGSIAMAGRKRQFLDLPDDIIAHIFTYLCPVDVTTLGGVSERIRAISHFPEVLRRASFHFTHRPALFVRFFNAVPADAIKELDISNCVQLGAVPIEECLRLCVNLTTLRCINTKIPPLNLLALTETDLQELRCLEWSVLSEHRQHAQQLLDRLKTEEVKFGLKRLKHMHIEADSNEAIADLLAYVLERCPEVRSVHVHEISTSRIESDLSRLMLDAFVKHEQWKVFTFTTALVTSITQINARTAAPHLLSQRDGKAAVRDDIAVYGNVSIIKKPNGRYIRSCTKLCDCCPFPITEDLSQILLRLDLPFSEVRLLGLATGNRHLPELRALTLVNIVRRPNLPDTTIVPGKATLGQFISACSGLRELNLTSFHASRIDCCDLLSQAVIPHLHSLSLPACALLSDTRLPQLANASFRLRVLDVRGLRLRLPHICEACADESSCTSACLSSLHQLCPLERLTLCNLQNVVRLDFLFNCSIAQLRMRDLGYWCMLNVPMMSPLRALCPKLHSLTLYGEYLPVDLLFLHHLQPADHLRRLCISKSRVLPEQQTGLLKFLLRLFPNANTLHVHTLQGETQSRFNFVWTRLPNDDSESVLSNDELELCKMCDFTGLQKPFLGQHKYAHL